MPIRADQLKEKEDYQKLILEHLRDDNGLFCDPAQWISYYLASCSCVKGTKAPYCHLNAVCKKRYA